MMKNLHTISLCGNFGDPLMHPQLDDVITIFNGRHIKISTNASLRDQEWWKDLGSKSNLTVTFCIDGLSDTHSIYRRNTSFQKIIRNARSFISAGGSAKWQFIVFKHNEHQIEKVKVYAKKLGFAEIKFIYSDRFDTHDKFPVYDKGEYQYDLAQATKQISLRERLNSQPGNHTWKKIYASQKKDKIDCVWSQQKKIYIHSDNKVYPCCMLGTVSAGKKIEKLLLGKFLKDPTSIDLSKKTFDQILKSDFFTEALPRSLESGPFAHPTCIAHCNKHSGKIINSDLCEVNS